MKRIIGVGALALAIGLSACPNRKAEVLGQRYSNIPVITAAPVPVKPPPAKPTFTTPPPHTPQATATRSETPVISKKAGAVYELNLNCVYDGKYKSGKPYVGAQKIQRQNAVAGLKMSYEFIYERDDESSDPIAQLTENCTLKSIKLQKDAAEPRLSVLLGCQGDVKFTQDQQPPSVIDKSWHELSQLTGGFTHTMKAPKNQYQLSEHDTCTISVVKR